MRVISFQNSFQDRTLKEDNFNLLVEKHTWRVERPERKPTGLWIWSKVPFTEKFENIIFIRKIKTFMFEFNKFIDVHMWKTIIQLLLNFFGTFWTKFRWSHCIYASPCHPSVYYYVMLALWTAWSRPYISREMFQPLEYCYYKVAMKQLVGHIYVFIVLTF